MMINVNLELRQYEQEVGADLIENVEDSRVPFNDSEDLGGVEFHGTELITSVENEEWIVYIKCYTAQITPEQALLLIKSWDWMASDGITVESIELHEELPDEAPEYKLTITRPTEMIASVWGVLTEAAEKKLYGEADEAFAGNEISNAMTKFANARDELIEKLEKLPQWLDQCNCDVVSEWINIVVPERSKHGESLQICLHCGGTLEIL